MPTISETLEAASAIVSGDDLIEEILSSKKVAATRSSIETLLTVLETTADTVLQKDICDEISQLNSAFFDAYEERLSSIKVHSLHREIFNNHEIEVITGEDTDEVLTGYEQSHPPDTKQYDQCTSLNQANEATKNTSFVALLDNNNIIKEETDRYYPDNLTSHSTLLGAQHQGCFADPSTLVQQLKNHPTTTQPKKTKLRKPPGAKSLEELTLVGQSTNTTRYTISAIDLQIFQPQSEGRALWAAKIKSEWKAKEVSLKDTLPTLEENVRFADFVKQENFKRRLGRQITRNKKTDRTFNDDPWYQELNAYLKHLNFERANHGLPEILVSFAKWTEKHKNSHKVKWEHRSEHRVLVLLRNQDETVHKVQMFDGKYLIEFTDFIDMEDNLGFNQAHSCWYKNDFR